MDRSSQAAPETTTRVVIIGAGFAGLNCAKSLCRKKKVHITIIDRANHHLFQPLLYQVATAGLSPADIAAPVRSVLRRCKNISVILAAAQKIDSDHKTVTLDNGEILAYDYLVVATGATHAYFGHDDWAKLAPGLKTLEDAVEIRRRILLAFEQAERERDKAQRQALLTFAIIGAGPTGVEMAGAIAELARFALAEDFANLNLREVRVLLVEAGGRPLQSFPEKLSSRAEEHLRKLGVEVLLNSRVTKVTAEGLLIGATFVPARTVVWAAGVTASDLGRQIATDCDSVGRVRVAADLTVPSHPEISVIGDLAAVALGAGKTVPAMAPGAIQEGKHAAKNIWRRVQGKPTESFCFFDKGSLATVGRTFAIAAVGPFKFSGFFALLIWIFVHILYLVSFRNRIFVLMEWAWNYLTFQKGARLITGSTKR